MRTLLLTLTTCLLVLPVQAKYSGGSGTAQNPYQIATAADLIALGETPADYDKHFILTADIDLDPSLPGRKVFDKAVIALTSIGGIIPRVQGTPFTGVFDGNGHNISHLTIEGDSYLGLFGRLEMGGEVKDLGVVDVNIVSSASFVGGLVGSNGGSLTQCYSTGTVGGSDWVGGLVGYSSHGCVTQCYSTGTVRGNGGVGGLVGLNGVSLTQCYSTGSVSGDEYVGGLVGSNSGTVTQCYSRGKVSAASGSSGVGGLVGANNGGVWLCVWDTKTSGSPESAGGVGLTTVEMMDPNMLGLNGFGRDPNWVLNAGRDYPRLAWEGTPGQVIAEPSIDWLQGHGTVEDPYRIDTAAQLILLGEVGILWDKHIILGADIDLDPALPGRRTFGQVVIRAFKGVFDGNAHKISHLVIVGKEDIGLFGQLASGAEVKNLGVVDVNVTGSGTCVGGLVAINQGTVTQCYSAGAVSSTGSNVGGLVGKNLWEGTVAQSHAAGVLIGGVSVGGLVGENGGTVTQCHGTGVVSGDQSVGGLVGLNFGHGTVVTRCYSTGQVSGSSLVGGLVGHNAFATVTECYSTGVVGGTSGVGGLVGDNGMDAALTRCYSTGAVSGRSSVGGLLGFNSGAVTGCYSTGSVSGGSYVGGLVGGHFEVTNATGCFGCFWDIQTSGQATSDGGTGKTTAQMQTAKTFLDAGWDFVGETANGTEDLWWILEGKDYPRLWWQAVKK